MQLRPIALCASHDKRLVPRRIPTSRTWLVTREEWISRGQCIEILEGMPVCMQNKKEKLLIGVMSLIDA
jgi:hypothetical protein